MEKHLLSIKIRNLAESIGIDAIGFAEASEFSDYLLNQHQRRDPHLNTGIPYHVFHRNVLIALERAKRISEPANHFLKDS
jgi:hypothetical protein